MKRTRISEEQIAFALRQIEGGASVKEVRRLTVLEEENRNLKRLVADLSLDKAMLQDVLGKVR